MNQTNLTVILYADIVGSTLLVHKDEVLAHQRIQDVFRKLSASIFNVGGKTHEIRGDALVAEFERASDAVMTALDFQQSNQLESDQLNDEIKPRFA